ncbi:hypothetical protein NM04_24490, partial [Massilia aurea]
MVYAALTMAPMIGATVAAFDGDAVRRMPGVLAVVDVSSALEGRTGAGAGVAVVASTWWQARQAAQALPVAWQPGEGAALSSAAVLAGL